MSRHPWYPPDLPPKNPWAMICASAVMALVLWFILAWVSGRRTP